MMDQRCTLLLFALVGSGCGSSDLDLLCAAGDGVWTLQKVVSEKCSGTSTRSVFTSSYMGDNCRGTLEPLFEAGTISIASSDVIEECRDVLRENECRPELYKDWLNATAICNEIIVGKLVPGGSCSVDEECGGAAFCRRTGACGACVAQGVSGATCTEDLECESGFCSAGLCVDGDVPANGACTRDGQCGTGLICRAGTCQQLEGHIDTACQADADCSEYQTSCVDGVCTALAKLDDACTTWASGAGTEPHCEWFASAGCAGGTCAGLPVAVAGEACGIDIGTCDATLWCSEGTCFPVTDEGGACTVTAECGPYAFCVNRVCTFSDFNASCPAS